MPLDDDHTPETSDDAFFDPVRDLLAEGEPTPIAPEAPPPPDDAFFAATDQLAPQAEPPPVEPDPPIELEAPTPEAIVLTAEVAGSGSPPGSRAELRRRRRRRTLVLSAAAIVVALAIVAALAMRGGNSNQTAAKLTVSPTTRLPATTTTAAPANASERTGPAGTTVTVDADVLFDIGVADLAPTASARLGQVLTLAQSDVSRHLLVEGYTDSTGDALGNRQLSEARARSVADWLTGQGIDSARITVVGHGADGPVAANDTPENRALNRRVVVTLQVKTSN